MGSLAQDFQAKPQLVTELLRAQVQVSSVACGAQFTMASTSVGRVYGWGANEAFRTPLMSNRTLVCRDATCIEPAAPTLRYAM